MFKKDIVNKNLYFNSHLFENFFIQKNTHLGIFDYRLSDGTLV